ncbi:MAG: 4'-phosphopantetheinyl transferase superfamily protein [Pirellulaceae bacterium]
MNDSSQRSIRHVTDFGVLPLPKHLHWLSEAEHSELVTWRDHQRREQWLAGRWIAKRLLCLSTLSEELRRVEILSRTAAGLGSQPRVIIDGKRLDRRLSISHAGRSVLVGLGAPHSKIGVDLALGVPHSERFRAAWFSPRENAWLGNSPGRRGPILWGLKEAIFKAQADGQAWNPRAVEVLAIENSLVYSELNGRVLTPLTAWIRPAEGGAATVVWDTSRDTIRYRGKTS